MAPADVDWESWLGPAPKVPYNKNRTFYRFRWFYDYSGGQLTNMGVHYLDLVHWTLGHDAPLAVTAMGGKFAIDDNREIPDTLEVLWTYPGNTLVTFSQYNASAATASLPRARWSSAARRGRLYLYTKGFEVVPEVMTPNDFPVQSPVDRKGSAGWRTGARAVIGVVSRKDGKQSTSDHARNFLDCLKSRKRCNCDIEQGHRDTSAALIANIALKTRSYLEWDAQSERFTNKDAANSFLSYKYRKPYVLPT